MVLNISVGVYSEHSNAVYITLGTPTGAEIVEQKINYPIKTYGRKIGYIKFGKMKKGETLSMPISCTYTPTGNQGAVYLMLDLYGS